MIDETNEYADFGASGPTSSLIKVALGEGHALPTRVGAAALEPSDSQMTSLAIDRFQGVANPTFFDGAWSAYLVYDDDASAFNPVDINRDGFVNALDVQLTRAGHSDPVASATRTVAIVAGRERSTLTATRRIA